MSTSLVQSRINKYDQQMKDRLVDLGRSKKSYNHILQYLNDEIQKSTKMSSFNYSIVCFKNDGVYQLHRAIEEIYGSAQGKSESQPSGGEGKLETVDVILADKTRIKVPYGTIALPEAGEDACIKIQYSEQRHSLQITGQCQFRFSSMIDDIVERTKELLSSSSVYKDQAIELDSKFQPSILDLSSIDKEFMVLSDRTEYELQPLRARLLNSQVCISKGISLKYGCLMEGPYGGSILNRLT